MNFHENRLNVSKKRKKKYKHIFGNQLSELIILTEENTPFFLDLINFLLVFTWKRGLTKSNHMLIKQFRIKYYRDELIKSNLINLLLLFVPDECYYYHCFRKFRSIPCNFDR